MAHLGSGNGTTYPVEIDTHQTWRNGPSPASDSDTRLDAEAFNDFATTLVTLQTILGARPNGTYGSVAARLNAALPGAGTSPGFVTFAPTTTVTIPGAMHNLGTSDLFYALYDAAVPAHAIQPDLFTVATSPNTYDLTITFVTPQSGKAVFQTGAPTYGLSFTTQTTVTIPGATHGLGTANLFYIVYDAANPAAEIRPNTVTVDPATFTVTLTFASAQSGRVLLSALGPRYVTTFTNQTSVVVPGSTHHLDTPALLWQIWDAATPRAPVRPSLLSIDAVTADVTVTFAAPQSGTLVLGAVPSTTGTEFELRDGGITNTSATRVRSASGTLDLQMGSGPLTIRDRLGAIKASITQTGQLGVGVTSPSFQLQLATDSAAKPGSSTWQIFSDARLKTVLRAFTQGLDVIRHLAPVVYTYNGKGGIPASADEHVGLIAQAVVPIAPYLVGTYYALLEPTDSATTELLTFEGQALQHLLINAVKELAAAREAQDARLTALEARLALLEAAAEGTP